MSIRRVWAPRAEAAAVVIGDARLPMSEHGGGWWACEIPPELSQSDYSFSLDGRDPVPDPRSSWQPHGVHGASRPLDLSCFEWNDSGWNAPPLSSALVYECHIGTFTPKGTFESAIEKLDYLKDLGVTHVELMPVAEFPGAHGWGYDGVDLFAPHHEYGGPIGLKNFVNQCHIRGMAAVLDVVYNHFGPDGNYTGIFGPYATDRYKTPWGDAINLDGEDAAEVRRFLCDNALMWLRDYHFDALRLDAVHAIFDSSAIHFLEQLATEVHALEAHLGRRLVLIAESDLNQPRIVTAREAGGYGIDAQWSDDFHHAIHAYLTGDRAHYYTDFGALADIATSLVQPYVYDGRYSRFRGRLHGRSAAGLPADRFVACLQNHDQVGNRAQGDRLGMMISPAMLKIAAALLLTSPYVPLLFQGEEWNASSPFLYFTNHSDPRLGAAVTAGRRKEFSYLAQDAQQVPDPQEPETFRRSKLNWSERLNPAHREILEWYRTMIELRRRYSDFTDPDLGDSEIRFDETARCLCVRRGGCYVACNFAQSTQQIEIASDIYNLQIAASSTDGVALSGKHAVMPAETVAILVPIQKK